MQFFPSDKRLRGIFFQNHPPPPPQELTGRPLIILKGSTCGTCLYFANDVVVLVCQYIRFSLHEHTPKRGDASATLKEAYFFQMPEFELDN